MRHKLMFTYQSTGLSHKDAKITKDSEQGLKPNTSTMTENELATIAVDICY